MLNLEALDGFRSNEGSGFKYVYVSVTLLRYALLLNLHWPQHTYQRIISDYVNF